MIEIKMKMRDDELVEGKMVIKGNGKDLFHETVTILKSLHDQLPDDMFTEALAAMVTVKMKNLLDEED